MSANKIPKPIADGLAPFYVLAINNDSAKGDENPIVCMTVILEGWNLRAVLKHQKNLGNRFGNTYVAECRIIPELTKIDKDF